MHKLLKYILIPTVILTTSLGCKKNLETKIQKQETRQNSITVVDSIKIGDKINYKEKVGFELEKRYKDKNNNESFYQYKVSNLGNFKEILHIRNYHKGCRTSCISIYEENHDTIPEDIWVEDIKNNIEFKIKNKKGQITLSGNIKMSQENIEQMYKEYSKKINDFKRKNYIKELLEKYNPKLEITTLGP